MAQPRQYKFLINEFHIKKCVLSLTLIFEPRGEGEELPYEEYTGVCHELRVIFSRKNSEKGMSIFHKKSGKGYNICKKFQIGSVIL